MEKGALHRITKVSGSGLDHKPATRYINQWDAREIVRDGWPIYVSGEYWTEQVKLLPNPPITTAEIEGRNPWDTPGRPVWWDGASDLLLLAFPGRQGTGHQGIYDMHDEVPVFDNSSRWLADRGAPMLFVPTSAINLERTGLRAHHTITALAQYKTSKWPSAAMIANFAQYGMSTRVIAEALDITRQAISLALKRMPPTIGMMVGTYKRGIVLPVCSHEGCTETLTMPHARYCPTHATQRVREGGLAGLREIDRLRAEGKIRVSRGGGRKHAPVSFAPPVANGRVDEWLPLVDQ